MLRALLPGPEIFWLTLYLLATLVAMRNRSSSGALDKHIENCWFWVPLLVLFTFALWWIPGVEKRWLLLRVWIAGLIGGHLVLEKLMGAYSQQGPGIGMGYLAGIIFLFLVLVVGSIVVLIRFR